jgi:uncharacterized protein (TIGR00369 family)
MIEQALSADIVERVRASFARQAAMQAIGASILRLAPGEVELTMPYRAELTQQHGFLHAGIVTTLADSACGYAALSTMPLDSDVLSVEFKVNLLRPAAGQRFRALGSVLKSGRTLVVTRGDVWAAQDDQEILIATMLATMIRK